MSRLRLVLLAGLAALLLAPGARADDVLDELERARRAYERHDYAAAADAADTAQKLIRQAQAEAWTAMLPEPLPGWTAEKPQSNAVAPVLLGGGISTSRLYRRGTDTIEVSIIASAPLILQGIAPFLTSGLFSGGDTKLALIDGRKATYERGDNTYTMMVDDRALIRVKGSRGVDDDTLRDYLRAVKLAEIGKAAR